MRGSVESLHELGAPEESCIEEGTFPLRIGDRLFVEKIDEYSSLFLLPFPKEDKGDPCH